MKTSSVLLIISLLLISVSGAMASAKCTEVIRKTCSNLEQGEILYCITKENHCPITYSYLSAFCDGMAPNMQGYCMESYQDYAYFMDDACNAMKTKLKENSYTKITKEELKKVIANACSDNE